MHKRIMVAMDGSDASKAALTEAVRLAGAGPDAAAVRVVTVYEVPYAVSLSERHEEDQLEAELRDEAAMILEEAKTLARREGCEPETAVLGSGDDSVADVIVADAERWGADVIVVGTHGRKGLSRILQGSVSSTITRKARVPVVVVPAGDRR